MTLEKKVCIFCDYNISNEGLLDETENFYFRAVVKGAMAPGHTMIISKNHYSCFGDMPSSLDKEYSNLVEDIGERIRKAFGMPIIFEQGIHGQSVNHAHLHFFPATSEWYDFTKSKSFMGFIPLTIDITYGKDLKDIRKVFEEEGQYISIKEKGNLYICHTRDYEQKYNGVLKPARDFTAKLTGKTHLVRWQTMPHSEKEKNKKWINETIKKLKRK